MTQSPKQLDQWFTRPEVAEMCVSHLNLSGFSEIIDPCAGDGAFRKWCTRLMDIDPKHPDIEQQDFLSLQLPHSPDRLFLTNFPYGHKAKLSIEMINHAADMADTVATIVPKTLMRYSAQKHIRSDLKLNLSIDLPKNSFVRDGKVCDVNSAFQVWSRNGECLRAKSLPTTHPDFIISRKYNPKAEFAIRGVRPKIVDDIEVFKRISPKTRYYSIQPLVPGVEERFRSIDLVSLCGNAGMPSMSIGEVIKAYDDAKMRDIEIHIFQKQQHSYKWLDWDYNVAIARCEKNPTVIVGSRVSDDRHWLLIKCDSKTAKQLASIDWSRFQMDKTTAGISKGDVLSALRNEDK